jgi:hypothetical protein
MYIELFLMTYQKRDNNQLWTSKTPNQGIKTLFYYLCDKSYIVGRIFAMYLKVQHNELKMV